MDYSFVAIDDAVLVLDYLVAECVREVMPHACRSSAAAVAEPGVGENSRT